MLNIDLFVQGNEFKNDAGDVYKVVANFSEGKKIYVELEKYIDSEDI